MSGNAGLSLPSVLILAAVVSSAFYGVAAEDTAPATTSREDITLTEATEWVQAAIDLSDAGDYDGARELSTRAAEADPDDAQAYFERGMVFMNLDREADAVADFSRVLEIDPEYPGALDWRRRALASLGEFRRAAEDCLRDLEDNPEGPHKGLGVNPQRWADCAENLAKAGESARAEALLETYFASHADKVTMYATYETAPMRLLAKLKLESGDGKAALAYARQAHSSEHQVPTDVVLLALALEASGDVDGARAACAEAMAINDQMPGVRALHQRLRRQ